MVSEKLLQLEMRIMAYTTLAILGRILGRTGYMSLTCKLTLEIQWTKLMMKFLVPKKKKKKNPTQTKSEDKIKNKQKRWKHW